MTQGGEEAAEMISTIRGEHVAMKTWFNGTNPAAVALRSKWGDYPGLWKEVLNWKGWKEARKAYLADQQRNEMLGNTNAAGNGTADTRTATPRSQVPIKMENSTPNDNSHTTNDGDAAVPRKRKSRWGTAAPDEQPRKSRWETPAAPPVAASTFQSNSATNAAVSVPMPSLPSRNQPSLPGLPGMPANLTPQQQQEMAKYQARLREVNDKLQVVEREAARVDSLPRGHRERSPSPPPGTVLHLSYAFAGVIHPWRMYTLSSDLETTVSYCEHFLQRLLWTSSISKCHIDSHSPLLFLFFCFSFFVIPFIGFVVVWNLLLLSPHNFDFWANV